MKKIFIIGSGELGSRHLQSLKNIKTSLEIYIIDPSNKSLKIAQERYDSVNIEDNNTLFYKNSIDDIKNFKKIDIAIIATSSNVRYQATLKLLEKFETKTIIFEKILFDKREDYFNMSKVLEAKKIKAYVNCTMRMFPFYKEIKKYFKGDRFKYIVSGSQFGLITNLVHFIDHISYLNGNYEYTCDLNMLDKKLFKSKRKSFYELNGTFQVNFKNGTQGVINCEPVGNAPITIQAFNDKVHFIVRESEGTVLISKFENDWKWEEFKYEFPFQSNLTSILVQDILKTNRCELPPYEFSMHVHLPHLDELLKFINLNSRIKFNYYPFT
tara:strand:- start:80 stop:1057 length:978 start_codon:yes stop_codon:yes gene_type:complete